MKIGILTSGGDCPGLNAVIRGVVLKGKWLDRAALDALLAEARKKATSVQ